KSYIRHCIRYKFQRQEETLLKHVPSSICSILEENIVSHNKCKYCSRRFKSADFDANDRSRHALERATK
ncbi:hypothetical protein EAI_08133, partial [Harpegnathos saltator]